MYITVSIFYVSFLTLIIMIVLKRQESRTGKASILSRLGRGADHFFDSIFSSADRTISYINRHTFIVIGQHVAFHLLLRIRKIYVEIKHRTLENPHGRKILDAVRGRGEVKKHGASLYLKRISTHGK